LKLPALYDRRPSSAALFLSSVHSGLKCCPSLLDAVDIKVPLFNFRNCSLFFASNRNSPNARCVLAANFVLKGVDLFSNPITALKQTLY
jgi:hypothetical protein